MPPTPLVPPLSTNCCLSVLIFRRLNSFKNVSSYGHILQNDTFTLLGKLPPSRCLDDTEEYFFCRE